MNTFVPLEKLEEMDRDELKDFYEIWLTSSETWPQDPERTQRECLWRADRQFTQDVEIDEAYFHNLPRLWLVVKDLNDTSAVGDIEQALGQRFQDINVKGEFRPVEKEKVACGDKKTDLRS